MPARAFSVTCPVADVERATAFCSALGWTLNADGYHFSPFWMKPDADQTS